MATSDEKNDNTNNTTAEDGNLPSKSKSSPIITTTAKFPLEIESESAPHPNDSFLGAVFGSEKNVSNLPRSSNTSKKGVSRRVFRYSSNTSEDDADERRGVVVTPLSQERGKAMGAGERLMKNLRGSYRDEEVGDSGDSGVRVYRLQATTKSNKGCCEALGSFLWSVVNCGALTDSTTSMDGGRYNPNIWITNFFYWLFRKGWMTVIMVSLFSFYLQVLLFTLLIVIWTVYVDSDCVRVGGLPFGSMENRSLFMDAFSLSWTTFSTVGYGSTYPSLSTEHDHEGDARCSFISFLTSFEAFVGVMYVGFTGGIIFAKVTRITQRAKVKFSDPLLVKYGAGVDAGMGLDDNSQEIHRGKDLNESNHDDLKVNAMEAAMEAKRPSPFPVLEFRLANELHSITAGEIIGSQVNAVVVIEGQQDGEEVGDALAKQIKMERLRRTSKTRKSSKEGNPFATTSEHSNHSDQTSSTDKMSVRSSSLRTSTSYLQSITAKTFGNKKMKIDEEEGDGGSVIVPRMIFSKLSLDHSEHPFFKRLWTFRHTINGDSPLLSTAAKQRIMENGGLWPKEWNNEQAVSNAIRFNQIIVSFTGVSNISAADVYKQKVYDSVDLTVGYQFVNPLYRGRSGKLKVDMYLLNDVVEQNGGGGENLHVIEQS